MLVIVLCNFNIPFSKSFSRVMLVFFYFLKHKLAISKIVVSINALNCEGIEMTLTFFQGSCVVKAGTFLLLRRLIIPIIRSEAGKSSCTLTCGLSINLVWVQQAITSLRLIKLDKSLKYDDTLATKVIKTWFLLKTLKNSSNCISIALAQALSVSLERCIVRDRRSSKASINSRRGIFSWLAILRKVSSVGDIPPLNHLDQLLICMPVRCLKSLYESCKNFSLLVTSHTYISFTTTLVYVTVFANKCVMLLTNIAQARNHLRYQMICVR